MPVLKAEQARQLLDSIPTDNIVDLRDRTPLGVMCYSFAPVSAVVHMNIDDYYQNGKRWWFRVHEKNRKCHEMPAHHNAEAYTDAYLDRAGIWEEKKGPLFRRVDKHRKNAQAIAAHESPRMTKLYDRTGDETTRRYSALRSEACSPCMRTREPSSSASCLASILRTSL